MPSPIDLLELPFLRTALLELLLLGVAGGLLGAWVVLRRLAFFAHAVGTATFPGLVVANAAGVAAPAAGMVVALGYAGGVERLGRRQRLPTDAATGLLLVGALALGVVLASDVFDSGSAVDRLLFGTLLGLSDSDLAFSAGAAVAALAGTVFLGHAWLAAGFDPEGARAVGPSPALVDGSLLVLVAAAAVAATPAVGALLVSALLVVPAATARLLTRSVRGLVLAAVALAVCEGVAGLYLAYWLDVSPGPAVATLAAAAHGMVAAFQAVRGR